MVVMDLREKKEKLQAGSMAKNRLGNSVVRISGEREQWIQGENQAKVFGSDFTFNRKYYFFFFWI